MSRVRVNRYRRMRAQDSVRFIEGTTPAYMYVLAKIQLLMQPHFDELACVNSEVALFHISSLNLYIAHS